ncbi:MAG: hypothetical protein ACPHRO_15575, partial [Nannocystaceae bacterium]
MRSHVSSSPRAVTRLLSGALSLTMAATTCLPLHAALAAPAEEAAATEETTEAAPEVEVGGEVAVLAFEGNSVLADIIRSK